MPCPPLLPGLASLKLLEWGMVFRRFCRGFGGIVEPALAADWIMALNSRKNDEGRLLAQPPRRVFQAVIQSAAKAASLPVHKNCQKVMKDLLVQKTHAFNAHQRCGYSDLSLVRILLYTAGSRIKEN